MTTETVPVMPSGTCLFLGIMSLDIDLTADKVTAHRIVRVIMRGHEEKLGCFMPTPKGAVERGQKDVHNMFNGLQGLRRKPQGDITTLQVQQLRLPFNRAEAGNSSTYAIVIIHAHQMRVPNSHTHEVGGRRNPHTTGQNQIEPGRSFTRKTIGAADGGCHSGQTTTSSRKVLHA